MKNLKYLALLLMLNACHAEPNTSLSPSNLPEIHAISHHKASTPSFNDAQKLFQSDCLITVQHHQQTHPVRICPANTDKNSINQKIAVLPDARPVLFQNKILFLGAPDETSYQHGVLGDGIEARTLYTLNSKNLQHEIEPFTLPESLVFEHNTVIAWQDKIVAVVSGNGAGARLIVLNLKHNNWKIIAQSEPLPNYRWQSPFVFQNKLYSIHMPHIRGQLVHYQLQDQHLIGTVIDEGFSNHDYGSHDTQTATVLSEYALIPAMNYREIYALHHSGTQYKLSPALPAKIVRSLAHQHTSYWLLEDGSIWAWHEPQSK